MNELDVFTLKRDVIGSSLETWAPITIPAGSIATVVLVYKNDGIPVAYEIEVFLEKEDEYAIATVEASEI